MTHTNHPAEPHDVGQRARVIAAGHSSGLPVGTLVTFVEYDDDGDATWEADGVNGLWRFDAADLADHAEVDVTLHLGLIATESAHDDPADFLHEKCYAMSDGDSFIEWGEPYTGGPRRVYTHVTIRDTRDARFDAAMVFRSDVAEQLDSRWARVLDYVVVTDQEDHSLHAVTFGAFDYDRDDNVAEPTTVTEPADDDQADDDECVGHDVEMPHEGYVGSLVRFCEGPCENYDADREPETTYAEARAYLTAHGIDPDNLPGQSQFERRA